MSDKNESDSNKYFILIVVAVLVCFTAIMIAFVATGHPDMAFSILKALGMFAGGLLVLLLAVVIMG